MTYSLLSSESERAVKNKNILRRADNNSVVSQLIKVKAHELWLSEEHPYQDGSLPMNQQEFNRVTDDQKLETLGVLGPLHLTDGWRYFSRGVSSMLSGDAHSAKHLGYYAELRAGLSLLASAGIGLFGLHNIVVDGDGTIHNLDRKISHQMCWAALEYWVTVPGNVETLLESVSINGVSLLVLLRTLIASPSASQIGSIIMKEWGFDLSRGSSDRGERNDSSYNPTVLSPLSTDPSDDHDFLMSLWQSFEPSSAKLERHLFRKLLHIELLDEECYLENVQFVLNGSYEKLDDSVQNMLTKEFLETQPDENELHLLKLAKESELPASPSAMLARASLLLALAGAMVQNNFKQAGIDPLTDLEEWWTKLGIESGCWSPSRRPEEISDLWIDIEDALKVSSASDKSSRFDWLKGVGDQFPYLFNADRIALWSICR